MNNRKTFSLCYFLGRTFFLGFGFSLLSKLLDKDAWIAYVLGMLLGGGIIFLFQKGKEKLDSSIKDSSSFLKYPLLIIFFLFNLFVKHLLLLSF